MHYYITGDCHGNFSKLIYFFRNHKTTTEDVMIILGDVGLNFNLNEKDKRGKEILSEYQVTYLCIHGNHEARPDGIASYKTKVWHGGTVFYEKEYPNILFARDGEIYDFDGKKAMAIGGAYSIDKEYRLLLGMPWFSDEQPSDEIKAYVKGQLEKYDWKVDYILSHTCPLKYQPTELFLSGYNQKKVDNSTEEWMSVLEKRMTYEIWYFGHYHENKSYDKAELLFEGIKELGKKDFVQKVGRPKYRIGEVVYFDYKYKNEVIQCYGRIAVVDELGTSGQTAEVSYDIEGPYFIDSEQKVLYKHIVESDIESINEIKG